MRIAVIGGAGYVGSHVVYELLEAGHQVVVLDDLSKGHRPAVNARAEWVAGDVGDPEALARVLPGADGVVHLAARSLVSESVQHPDRYYQANVVKGLALLEGMRRHGVQRLVFSSTAAVYGEPEVVPIPEAHPARPTNPYGRTKLAFEGMLESYRQAYGLGYIALRYFNAAGANAEAGLGEDHDPETHLIPIVLQVALGQRERVDVFGDDYPTHDGTCVRDYIHVADLASAHRLALERLASGGAEASGCFNLGNGRGFSVLEVIQAVERVTGRSIPRRIAPRRAGDPAVLVASAERARTELGWTPHYPDLDQIVATAWAWHRAHPHGYEPADAAGGAPADRPEPGAVGEVQPDAAADAGETQPDLDRTDDRLPDGRTVRFYRRGDGGRPRGDAGPEPSKEGGDV